MSIEYDEKGKIFTDVVSKIAVNATIQTTTHLMRAQIHVRRDQRVIDELDLNENFLALTDEVFWIPMGKHFFRRPSLPYDAHRLSGSFLNKKHRRVSSNGHSHFK